MAEIADEHFSTWINYSRAFKEYALLKRVSERNWITFTSVFWGPPGVGKTRRALEEAGEGAYWLTKPQGSGTVWFDGYDGHEVVVIDEFYGWIPRDLLQRMCDRYPLLVQTKGGTVSFTAKRIIITSNKAPEDWYRAGLGAMERRLTGEHGRVEYMDGGGAAAGPGAGVAHSSQYVQPRGGAAVECSQRRMSLFNSSDDTI